MVRKRAVVVLLGVLLLLVLVGCGAQAGVEDFLGDSYTLVDVRPSRFNTGDEALVYQAGEPVGQVAQALAQRFPPDSQTSPANDERMVLVYPDLVVDVFQQEGTTKIETASKQYVRDHYDRNEFFQGLLTAAVIGSIFDGPRGVGWGAYPLYPGRGAVPSYGRSVRQGSVGAPPVVGGGIGEGK